MKSRSTLKWFLLMLFLGLFLRNFHLSEQSLWMDEGYTLETITWQESGANNAEIVWNRAIERESTPPLYFFIMYHWTQRFGFSPYDLRYLSMLFSTGSLIFIFLIARHLYNDRAGLMAMIIAAVAMPEITIAQEARVYAMFGFFALASTYVFLKTFFRETKSPVVTFVIYEHLMVLTLFLHYFGLIVLALHLFGFLLFEKRISKYAVPIFVIPLLCFFYFGRNYVWIQIRNNLLFLYAWLNRIGLSKEILAGLLLICMFGYIFLIARREELSKWFGFLLRPTFFSILSGFLILLAPATFIFFAKPTFVVRYLYFFFPVIYIYLGVMFARVKKKTYIAALILLLLLSLTIGYYFDERRKEQWKLLSEHIAEREQQEDIIFMVDKDLAPVFKYYYTGHLKMVRSKSTSNETANLNQWNAVYALTNAYDRIWFIDSHNHWSGTFWHDKFNESYDVTAYGKYTGINLYYLEKRNVSG